MFMLSSSLTKTYAAPDRGDDRLSTYPPSPPPSTGHQYERSAHPPVQEQLNQRSANPTEENNSIFTVTATTEIYTTTPMRSFVRDTDIKIVSCQRGSRFAEGMLFPPFSCTNLSTFPEDSSTPRGQLINSPSMTHGRSFRKDKSPDP